MPLPPPPGYKFPQQSKIDKRRVLLSCLIFTFLAAVLFILFQRANRVPGSLEQPIAIHSFLLVVLGAGACGFWGESMRQLSLIAKSKDSIK